MSPIKTLSNPSVFSRKIFKEKPPMDLMVMVFRIRVDQILKKAHSA
jgi:hypothetical protein